MASSVVQGAGFDESRFDGPVSENFKCTICFNVLNDPKSCQNNQHYFCSACIHQYVQDYSQTCPECRQELTVETLVTPPRILLNCISELPIKCDHVERGCAARVQLGGLQNHLEECGFAPVTCANDGCDAVVNKRDRIHHETELCEFRRVQCHNCEELRNEMSRLSEKQENLSKTAGERQAKLEGRLDQVTTRLQTIEKNVMAKITGLNLAHERGNASVVQELRNEMSRLSEKQGNLSKTTGERQAKLEGKVDQVTTRLQNIEGNVNALNLAHNSGNASLVQEITEIKSFMNDVLRKLSNINNVVCQMQASEKQRTQENDGEDAQIKSHCETSKSKSPRHTEEYKQLLEACMKSRAVSASLEDKVEALKKENKDLKDKLDLSREDIRASTRKDEILREKSSLPSKDSKKLKYLALEEDGFERRFTEAKGSSGNLQSSRFTSSDLTDDFDLAGEGLDSTPSPERASSRRSSPGKGTPFAPESPRQLDVGMSVIITRDRGKLGRGVVRYIGYLPEKQNKIYIGLELEDADGMHDGKYNGQRFFKCKQNHGIFVLFEKVAMAYT